MEIVRKSISFPKELAERIAKSAEEGNRSFSAQVIYELKLPTVPRDVRGNRYVDIPVLTREEREIEDEE